MLKAPVGASVASWEMSAFLPPWIWVMLDGSVLVFARRPNPTRRDPSFMKTFRLMGKYMVPSSYMRDDGRVEVAKFDWSEDVRVTNSAAVVRLNPSSAAGA